MRITRAGWFRRTSEPAADPAAIDRDIRRELEFHVRSSEEALIAAGMPASAASAEARRRFGDFDSAVADCRRIRFRRHMMIQRVNTVLLALLLVAVAFLGMEAWTSHAAHRQAVSDLESRLDRIGTLLAAQEDAGDRRDESGAKVGGRPPVAVAEKDSAASRPTLHGVGLEAPPIGTFFQLLGDAFR